MVKNEIWKKWISADPCIQHFLAILDPDWMIFLMSHHFLIIWPIFDGWFRLEYPYLQTKNTLSWNF